MTTQRNIHCTQPNCYLCENGLTVEAKKDFQQKGWHRRIVPTFVFLEQSNNQTFQHLANDVFTFIMEHWDVYWPTGTTQKPEDRNWKDSVKALLCRKKHQFQSGKNVYDTRGWWRLRYESDKKPYLHSVPKQQTTVGNSNDNNNIKDTKRDDEGRLMELKAVVKEMNGSNYCADTKSANTFQRKQSCNSNDCSLNVIMGPPQSAATPYPDFGMFTFSNHKEFTSSVRVEDGISEHSIDMTLSHDFRNFLLKLGIIQPHHSMLY